MSAIDHPPHYNAHPNGVECIELAERLPFCQGNAVKYLWRADHKGARVEDLRKALWYIDRALHSDPALANDTFACDYDDLVRRACAGFGNRVAAAIGFIAFDDLMDAHDVVLELIQETERAA
jgi:hypothetical protein